MKIIVGLRQVKSDAFRPTEEELAVIQAAVGSNPNNPYEEMAAIKTELRKRYPEWELRGVRIEFEGDGPAGLLAIEG